MLVAEALSDEILLQTCTEHLAAEWGTFTTTGVTFDHHQSHCLHVHCRSISFRTTVFSERDQSIRFDVIVLNNVYMYYSTRVSHWTSIVEMILKWPPHWMYYVINTYISHLEVRFAYINTYQVFLSAVKAVAVGSSEFKPLEVKNTKLFLFLASFLSAFFLSFFVSFSLSRQEL